MVAAITDLRYILESQPFVGKVAAGRNSNFLQREASAFVVERIHERPANRRLEPRSAMKRRVIVTDGSVIPPHAECEVVIRLVLPHQPLYIDTEGIIRCRSK